MLPLDRQAQQEAQGQAGELSAVKDGLQEENEDADDHQGGGSGGQRCSEQNSDARREEFNQLVARPAHREQLKTGFEYDSSVAL